MRSLDIAEIYLNDLYNFVYLLIIGFIKDGVDLVGALKWAYADHVGEISYSGCFYRRQKQEKEEVLDESPVTQEQITNINRRLDGLESKVGSKRTIEAMYQRIRILEKGQG